MARIEQGKRQSLRQSGAYRTEKETVAHIEQGKRQSGTYRAGKETEWHI